MAVREGYVDAELAVLEQDAVELATYDIVCQA